MNRNDFDLMSNDACELMADCETREVGSADSPRSYSMGELRDLLEAVYDRQYTPDVREWAPLPTLEEVDQCMRYMLSEGGGVIGKLDNGRVFMLPDDIAVVSAERSIMGLLRGSD